MATSRTNSPAADTIPLEDPVKDDDATDDEGSDRSGFLLDQPTRTGVIPPQEKLVTPSDSNPAVVTKYICCAACVGTKRCICRVEKSRRLKDISDGGCVSCGCTGCEDAAQLHPDPSTHKRKRLPTHQQPQSMNANRAYDDGGNGKDPKMARLAMSTKAGGTPGALEHGCCQQCMRAFSSNGKSCPCQVPTSVRRFPLPSSGCRICGCGGCSPMDRGEFPPGMSAPVAHPDSNSSSNPSAPSNLHRTPHGGSSASMAAPAGMTANPYGAQPYANPHLGGYPPMGGIHPLTAMHSYNPSDGAPPLPPPNILPWLHAYAEWYYSHGMQWERRGMPPTEAQRVYEDLYAYFAQAASGASGRK
jgi:hypothetical protein